MEVILDVLCPTVISREWVSGSRGHHHILKAVRNSLVANPGRKEKAIQLGLVGELLNLIETSTTGVDSTNDGERVFLGAVTDDTECVLHSIGLLGLLASHHAFLSGLTEVQAHRLLCQVKQCLKYGDGLVQASTLRTLTMIYDSTEALDLPDMPESVVHGILKELIGWTWTEDVKLLGIGALAAMTRDDTFARKLAMSVAALDPGLLVRPLLRICQHNKCEVTKAAKASRQARFRGGQGEKLVPLLELLNNLSSQLPTVIGQWIDNYEQGEALLGCLENLLTYPEEKVRILTGMVLVHMSSSRVLNFSEGGMREVAIEQCKPHSLEHIVTHRAVPLFARSLSAFAKALKQTCGGEKKSTVGDIGVATGVKKCSFRDARLMARAVAEATGQGTRRQKEALQCGAVNALAEWMQARTATEMTSINGDPVKKGPGGREEECAMVDCAALSTLGVLCSNCEEA
ncbi:unnamed protein product, partial [Choristocarpus tenellus]